MLTKRVNENKKRNERARFKVDFTTIDKLELMPFVFKVEREPEINVWVWTENSPEYPVRARFGEIIVQQQRREYPWIYPLAGAECFAKVFNEIERWEEGGER